MTDIQTEEKTTGGCACGGHGHAHDHADKHDHAAGGCGCGHYAETVVEATVTPSAGTEELPLAKKSGGCGCGCGH